ncbi:MAG: PEP-CTERM sorting domain-containing protein [Coraliomargarita sp.]
MKVLFHPALFLLLAHGSLHAITTSLSSSVYSVTEGVAFNIGNTGASHFTFSWTDSNGSFGSFSDPTLVLTAGQTYTFQRTSGSHPFIITDDTLPVSGTDGSYSRTTSEISVMNNSLLGGPADTETFKADPGPTTDLISWTPTTADIGDDFYYTCYVTGHPGMTGRISVVPEPGAVSLWVSGAALVFAFFRRRR